MSPDIIDSTLIKKLTKYSQHREWRVRKNIAEILFKFVSIMSSDTYTEKVKNILLLLLQDRVYSVRFSTVDILQKLCVSQGSDWTNEKIIPEVSTKYSVTF